MSNGNGNNRGGLRPAFYLLALTLIILERMLLISDIRHGFGLSPLESLIAVSTVAIILVIMADTMDS